jgi:hypothetical protein
MITIVYLNSGATLRRSGMTTATPEAILGKILILNFFTTELSPTDFWCLKCVYIYLPKVSPDIHWKSSGIMLVNHFIMT